MDELERQRTGRCLCGSVTATIARLQRHAMHCHCENCRRVTGNFVAAVRVLATDLAIHDPEGLVEEHELGFARYGFCGGCGSTLYFWAQDRPEGPSIMVGFLDDVTGIGLHSVWFAGEAQPHHTLDDRVPHHRGNE